MYIHRCPSSTLHARYGLTEIPEADADSSIAST
jgi:hypothetical protein